MFCSCVLSGRVCNELRLLEECHVDAQGLRRTLGSAPLNINEVRAVLRLLRYICKHKDPELLRLLRRAQAADGVLVPAADSRLVPASACAHTLTCRPHLLSR